jgi:hypothetical protein
MSIYGIPYRDGRFWQYKYYIKSSQEAIELLVKEN